MGRLRPEPQATALQPAAAAVPPTRAADLDSPPAPYWELLTEDAEVVA